MDPFTPFKTKSSRRLVLVNEIGLQRDINAGFVRFFAKRGLPAHVVGGIIEDEPGFKAWAKNSLIPPKLFRHNKIDAGRQPAVRVPRHFGGEMTHE